MILRRRAGWTMSRIGAAFNLTASGVQRVVGPGILATEPGSLHAPPDLVGYLADPDDKTLRRTWVREQMAAGLAVEEIARALEITPTAVKFAAGMI